MNKREMFRKIREASLGGMFPAIDTTGKCFYEKTIDKKTFHCVIGLFLPKGKFKRETENIAYLITSKKKEDLLQYFPKSMRNVDVLRQLQRIHDQLAGKCFNEEGTKILKEKWDHELFMREVKYLMFPPCFK